MQIDKNLQGKTGIYCITNTKNNKMYVGSSKNIYYRLHRHKSDLLKNQHANKHLQNSVNKYGIDSFNISILEFCNINVQFEIEQKYLDTGFYSYNKSLKAEKVELSIETRRKIGLKIKENYKAGKQFPTKTRKINVFDLEGNLLSTHNMIKDASIFYNIGINLIKRCLKGIYKQTHQMQFKYFNDTLLVNKVFYNEKTKTSRKIKDKKISCYYYKPKNNIKKSCFIENIETKEIKYFPSLSSGSNFIGMSCTTFDRYFYSGKLCKNKYLIRASR